MIERIDHRILGATMCARHIAYRWQASARLIHALLDLALYQQHQLFGQAAMSIAAVRSECHVCSPMLQRRTSVLGTVE